MTPNLLSAVRRLFRRSAQSRGEPGQASRAARLSTGKWTPELLKHLEWRRLEELCAAYFEELAFKTAIAHERADGAAEICLYGGGEGEPSILVHTKAGDPYPIGIKPLRELHAAMTSAKVAQGVMVT